MKTIRLSSSKRFRGLLQAVCCSLFLIGVGCTTTPSEPLRADDPDRHAPLIVARTGDTAQLSWQSRLGNLYTVIYLDGQRVGGEWRPLPGAERIRGNGGEIRLEDDMPRGVARHYRLMVVPAETQRTRTMRR